MKMRKFKKMALGMALAICMFGSNVSLCYAVTSSISMDLTASNLYAKFVYAEQGHKLTLTAFWQEATPDGNVKPGNTSSTQFGSVTEVIVVRNSPDGYRYTWGRAFGDVDGKTVAVTGEITVP